MIDIHSKINTRSYNTTNIGLRLLIPYMNLFVYDRPRFYFNCSKRLVFNFKK